MTAREHAIQIFKAGVAAVQPARLLPKHIQNHHHALTICGRHIPLDTLQHLYVVGAGKAAAAMAVATADILGNRITGGVVTTKYGHALPCPRIKILEAAHPVPDNNCVLAASETLALLQQAGPRDVVVCLLSGGASALWCDVPPGIHLPHLQLTFDLLIKSGASIQQINTVRKHLSLIKGGQLIRHCGGAAVYTLIISDVPGDNLQSIASGPTVGDDTSFDEAYLILQQYGLIKHLPHSILQYITSGREGALPDTPLPGDVLFSKTTNAIIGTNATAVQAAAAHAGRLGYEVVVINEMVSGDAVAAAKKLVRRALQYQGKQPCCIIQGGEPTLQVTGNGKGGRNQHLVLAALGELWGEKDKAGSHHITIMSGGTDGTDGPTDAAGAAGDALLWEKGLQQKINPDDYLKRFDAYHFFEQVGGLIKTGPTQTNVMDLMIAIVQPPTFTA